MQLLAIVKLPGDRDVLGFDFQLIFGRLSWSLARAGYTYRVECMEEGVGGDVMLVSCRGDVVRLVEEAWVGILYLQYEKAWMSKVADVEDA